MKKSAPIAIFGLLACGTAVCPTGHALADEYPTIPPIIEIYSGANLLHTSDEPRSSYASPLHEPRSGASKAIEYQDEHSSLLFGGIVEAFPLPQRFFLEAKVLGDDDWFGELQHSYKDYYQLRLLSRRFEHNLDNLTLFNTGPMLSPPSPNAAPVDRQDVGREYSLGIDIDTFKLRLKTPNFPLHLYTEGELVRREGNRQFRFLGGSATNSSRVRVSQAKEVDQETREITVGVNSHLRWIEADLAHAWQKFDDDAAVPHYDYLADPGDRDAGSYAHSNVPELTASKNTLKVHTTHTGQLFASATLMDLERDNDSSGVEAERRLGHGDLMWTPWVNLSLGAKFRHQQNDSAGPASVATNYTLASLPFDPAPVVQGVEGATDSFTTFIRYAPISKVTLKGQYNVERLGRDEDSAVDWHLAEEKETETLDLGVAWRPRRDLKLNAKYISKDIAVDSGEAVIFNNDPERTHQYLADVTYLPTVKTSLLLSALLRQDKAGNLQILDSDFEVVDDPGEDGGDDYDALWQRYLASLTHACTERLSVSGSYSYSVMDTERGFAAETATAGSYIIDEHYNNQQAYHNIGLGASFQATERLSLAATVDYTLASGDYTLNDLFLRQDLSLGDISEVDTKELGLRLDSEYELGQGWKVGAILRYVDWIDKSFDNPGDGDMAGALFKLSKKLY